MAIGKQFFDFIEDRQKDVANAISSGVKAVDGFIDDNIPGGKEYTDNWANGVQKIGNHINDINTGFKQIAREPIDSVDDVAPFLVGSFLQGSEDFTKGAENIASDLGIDSRAGTVLGAVADEVALFGLGQVTRKVSKLPPTTPMPQALPVAVEAGKVKAKQLGALPEQVFASASSLPRPTNWQNRAATLFRGENKKKLAELFWKGQNKPGMKLKQKNMFVTPDELAHDKDGLLQFLIDQADEVQDLFPKALTNDDIQRKAYDAAAENPFIDSRQIYGSQTPRNYLTKMTNWLSNDEWHHIFGNKEAGEFILSMANSDPVIAVNLFAKMKALNLTSSGIAQNIALMKKYKHTQWHDFIKEMGFEPKSPMKKGKKFTKGSTAPGDFADLSISLSREIVAGRGDINDAFRMLELYAEYNKWVRSKLPDFGAEVISDLPEGVGKALQLGGYYKRPPKPAASRTPLYIKQ